METTLLILGALALAYFNGANDNFKGVATLFGSQTIDYKEAIRWATLCTFAGSLAAIFFAKTLVKNFSGKGLVPDGTAQLPEFVLAVLAGAIFALLIATLIGMPISTTHSLVGGLVGGGMAMAPGQVNFSVLGAGFLLPLLFSPVAAIMLGYVVYKACHFARLKAGLTSETCVCIGERWEVMPGKHHTATASSFISLDIADEQVCRKRYTGQFLGLNAQGIVDTLHFLSAGWLSFARGLNDTPKIAGVLLLTTAFGLPVNLLAVGMTIALGGMLSARKVGITVGKKVTPMNAGQGLSANVSAASLVTLASLLGLPVSTTHVSVGAIFGIGMQTNDANKKMIRNIALAWLLTLPVAALGSAVVAILIG